MHIYALYNMHKTARPTPVCLVIFTKCSNSKSRPLATKYAEVIFSNWLITEKNFVHPGAWFSSCENLTSAQISYII